MPKGKFIPNDWKWTLLNKQCCGGRKTTWHSRARPLAPQHFRILTFSCQTKLMTCLLCVSICCIYEIHKLNEGSSSTLHLTTRFLQHPNDYRTCDRQWRKGNVFLKRPILKSAFSKFPIRTGKSTRLLLCGSLTHSDCWISITFSLLSHRVRTLNNIFICTTWTCLQFTGSPHQRKVQKKGEVGGWMWWKLNSNHFSM